MKDKLNQFILNLQGQCIDLVSVVCYNTAVCQKVLKVSQKVISLGRTGKADQIILEKTTPITEGNILLKNVERLARILPIKARTTRTGRAIWLVSQHYMTILKDDLQSLNCVKDAMLKKLLTFQITVNIPENYLIGNGFAKVAIVKKINLLLI